MKSSCPGVVLKDTSFDSKTDALETGGNYSSVSQQQHAQSESVSQQQNVQSEQIIVTDVQQHNNVHPSNTYQNSNQELGSLDVTHNVSSLPLDVLSDSIEIAARPTR
ncbi:hypothetical protein V6N11_031602 [Hibiscus sabdariffa]|uniref:Uncharacterized protein n=1 Tax=Hibiscus sabdariffa TaxID=183260 RepID=A0ABR2SYS7_9ROSI